VGVIQKVDGTMSDKPGPLFGTLLEAVETAQLEGTITSKEEALEWLTESLKKNESTS
jgi:hypothetical protein